MFVTPGLHRPRAGSSRSTSRTRRMRDSAISTPSSTGSAPPDRPGAGAARHPRHLRLVAGAHHRRPPPRLCRAAPPPPGVTAYWSSPSDSYVRELVLVGDEVLAPDDAAERASSERAVTSTKRPSSPARCRLQVHEHAHQQDQQEAPLQHLTEQVALLARHAHRRGADREVLRRDHLAEHAAGAVAPRRAASGRCHASFAAVT